MKFKIENDFIGLRNTLEEEIDTICAIELQEENKPFIIPYNRQRHQQVISDSNEAHLTIWDKKTNELIGFVILAGLKDPDLNLEFRRVVIQCKGKGFGRRCLQMIKQHCFFTLNFHRLWLDVFDHNQRAIHLYKSEGFKEVNRQGNLIILECFSPEEYR